MFGFLEKIIVVTGHYGSGKTNLSVNLALDLTRQGKKVALADLDIVNPYFRTADFYDLADKHGITIIASPYANSSVELPTLNYGLERYFDAGETLILDVGGDDVGAIALGQYAHKIKQYPYTMLSVVNKFRSIARPPEEDAELLAGIEHCSRLEVTHICNNSHLGPLTTAQDIEAGIPWAEKVAELTGKPFAFTAVRQDLAGQIGGVGDIFPVEILVKTVWQ